MPNLTLTTLPFSSDSAALFHAIAKAPWAAFLDSCEQGVDILTANPVTKIVTRDLTTFIETDNQHRTSRQNPFDIIKAELSKQNTLADVELPSSLPFLGGAIGYFAYDIGLKAHDIYNQHKPRNTLPDMAVGLYDWAIINDHTQQQTYLLCAADKKPELLALLKQTPDYTPFQRTSEFKSNLSKESYQSAFYKIKQHIFDGDCYQANLSQRFAANATGSPWLAYQELRRANPGKYAAYLNTDWGAICSTSPECFLTVRDGQVTTQPIKGTRPRHLNAKIDQMLAAELLNSEKDKAENLMIVDLLRNDLGTACIPGTIKVDKLFDLESYASVHHLVSTIQGTLPPHIHPLDLMQRAFPGGSITGTPKRRAMEIIDALEPHRRSIYCGSIGYIDTRGEMDMNIAIRTLLITEQRLYCYAGGGIVADSECEAEYEETFNKVKTLLDCLSI